MIELHQIASAVHQERRRERDPLTSPQSPIFIYSSPSYAHIRTHTHTHRASSVLSVSTFQQMNFRARDVLAVLAAAWLIRMAWNDEDSPGTSLSATMRLAFYAHIDPQAFAPLDVDGDGSSETLAVFVKEDQNRPNQWQLQLLDLKPLHSYKQGMVSVAPFRPKPILSASIDAWSRPQRVVTGQIQVAHKNKNPKQKRPAASTSGVEFTDRNRRYFCGTDWHDASQKCGTPCPGGLPSECPGEEKCYADTPCDALAEPVGNDSGQDDEHANMLLTPSGGMPCVVSLWQDGTVRMHALKPLSNSADSTQLGLVELWSEKIIMGFDEFDIMLLGSEDMSSESSELGSHGVVIAGGMQFQHSRIQALDALTGEMLWNTQSNAKKPSAEGEVNRGIMSHARRRSRIVEANENAADAGLPNCWTAYRYSLMEDVLPFAYWGPGDRTWEAAHLDRMPKRKQKVSIQKWHHRHQRGPIKGRPNVLLSRTRNGIHVRSLKNGRSICHMSLLDRVMYADLNQDGTLDQLQVLTAEVPKTHNSQWVSSLVQQVVKKQQDEDNGFENGDFPRMGSSSRLCHLLALSGMPAREEILSTSLCDTATYKKHVDTTHPDIYSSRPLVTDNGDVIVALSNGSVSRHHVATGRRVWINHHHENSLPTWGAQTDTAIVTHVETKAKTKSGSSARRAKPVLVTGETGMALLSPYHGIVLSSTKFPQMSRSRPMLYDLSGDGVEDVVIVTNDAVWCYQMLVHNGGGGIVFRVLVGLLMMGIALALIRNHYNDGKRSSDL